MSAAKALFFSFFASLQNWRAFLVYGVAVAIVAGLRARHRASRCSRSRARRAGAQPACCRRCALVVVVILLPTLFASFYASYRDVFADQPAE